MKKAILVVLMSLAIAGGYTYWLSEHSKKFTGVDENVVERVAKEAGHPAREPYINTDKGDLLLFFFLIAGAGGGFIAGYCFRELFPPVKKS